jgi:hypothetical protein
MLAVHEELARRRFMASVEELGMQSASGVLEVAGNPVAGNPSGAIYLEAGRITFAQASWIPGLAARLGGIRPVPDGLTEVLADWGDEGDAAIAARVIRRGCLTIPRLHELIRSIVADALVVLTIPLAMDWTLAAVRFTATGAYLSGAFPRLDIAPVLREAARRAERMADRGLSPTTAVALHHRRLPAAILTREQWTVACQISGPASAQELAFRCGIALADTMECLDSLIRAGLCTPVRTREQRQSSSRLPPAALPAGLPTGRPSAEILLQVLNGLRKLS